MLIKMKPFLKYYEFNSRFLSIETHQRHKMLKQQQRLFASGQRRNRIEKTYKLALIGQQEYLNRLKHPTEAPEVDPALLTFQQRANAKFEDDQKIIANHIRIFHERCSNSFEATTNTTKDISIDQLVDSKEPKTIRTTQFDPFGKISIRKGSIFDFSADCAVIPTTPNFMPPDGLGLEALERGGKDLISCVVQTLKDVMRSRHQEVFQHKNTLESPEHGGSVYLYRRMLASSTNMCPGDIVVVPSGNASSKCPFLAFVVLPFFYEGGYNESATGLRYAITRVFQYLQREFSLPTTQKPPISIMVPMLGAGIHGFQPRNIGDIIVEESIEALLELNVVEPTYILKKIMLVSDKDSEVSIFCRSLEAAASRWLPDQQVVTARRYGATRAKRIIPVTTKTLRQLRSPCKFFFKSRESVRKPARSTFCGHIRPFVWRPRVRNTSSLPVKRMTGVPLAPGAPMKDYLTDQIRNHYGIKRLQVKKGEWVGNPAQVKRHRMRVDVKE